ncbi:MAG: hypothetical protein CMN28_08545, partial [Salinisphaeraceae bacterium]|nr:hypothetical protein [Salinisphaeraceae bacterium]
MKRILATVVLTVGASGMASAQNPTAALNAVTGAISGGQDTVASLLNMNFSGAILTGADTVNGLTTGLAAGTPAAPLADLGAMYTNTGALALVNVVDGLTALAPTGGAAGLPGLPALPGLPTGGLNGLPILGDAAGGLPLAGGLDTLPVIGGL